MVLRLLIAGLVPHDSGKTTIARIVLRGLKELGIMSGVSKPIAGHSLWYQEESVHNTLNEGLLIGSDAVILRNESGSRDPLALINPLDIATLPPDPEKFLNTPSIYLDVISITLKSSIIARISRCFGDRDVRFKHLIIIDNIHALNIATREAFNYIISHIKGDVSKISFSDFEKMLSDLIKDVEICLNNILNRYEYVVIESFNDASTPTYNSLNVDLVLVVSPSKVFLYEGDIYRKAFYIASSVKYISPLSMWSTTSDLIRLIKKYRSINVPPKWSNKEYNRFKDILIDLIMKFEDTKSRDV